MNTRIGISNRHVHLTREDVNILFGNNYELTKRNDLDQLQERQDFDNIHYYSYIFHL